MDPGRFRFEAQRFDPAPDSPGHFDTQSQSPGVLAAFSGGYLVESLSAPSPPGRSKDPVGLLLSSGRVLSPPLFQRGAFFQCQDLRYGLMPLGAKGMSVHWGSGRMLTIGAVNSGARKIDRPTLFLATQGPETPPMSATGLRFTGSSFLEPQALSEPCPIPSAGGVLALPPGADWLSLAHHLSSSTDATFRLGPVPGFRDLRDAIAGGPMLLQGGQMRLQPSKEDFAPGVPPVWDFQAPDAFTTAASRLAVGLTPAHEVVVASVDSPKDARRGGLGLRQLAEFMRTLGCIDAVNFAADSRKRIVVEGETVVPVPEIAATLGEHRHGLPGVGSGFLIRRA